jgi:hypothetical protein
MPQADATRICAEHVPTDDASRLCTYEEDELTHADASKTEDISRVSNAHEPERKKLCLNGCFTVKPVSEFGRDPRSRDGLLARCRPCERDRLLLAKHGMTTTERDAIAAEQGGCGICGRPDPTAKGWVVDHDRACCAGDRSCVRCRRGILCGWCNSALGYAFDDPAVLRRMADYLESGQRIHPSATELTA